MKRRLLVALGILGLMVGCGVGFTPGEFRALAQATAVPSCVFAGYDSHGSGINTGITCVTPAASGAPQGTPAAGTCIGITTPPPQSTISYTCPTPYPTPSAVTAVQATATSCGAAVGVTTPFPSPIVQVPVCPTASAGPSLPLSVANGGTGTAAPAPTSSNGCSVTGVWPSQTFACPTGTPAPTSPSFAAIGVDNQAAGATGFTCGVPNTTNCVFAMQNGTSTFTGYTFTSATTCSVNSGSYFAIKIAGTTKWVSDCLGNTTASGLAISAGVKNSSLGSATVSTLCGANATNESQCTVNQTNHAYSTTLTSASGCTALTQCGTISFTFPTAYTAAPFCGAPGIQDTSTPADLWVGDIDAISNTAITYSYATLITLVGTKNLTVTFTCGAI